MGSHGVAGMARAAGGPTRRAADAWRWLVFLTQPVSGAAQHSGGVGSLLMYLRLHRHPGRAYKSHLYGRYISTRK